MKSLPRLTGVALVLISVFLVWGALLYFAASPPETADLFWHMASGRYFVENWTFPDHDPFSHTVSERPWILQQWAFQVLVYGADALGGPFALRAVSLVLVAALLGAFASFFVRRSSDVVNVCTLLVVLGVVSTLRLTQLRPHLVSILLFVLFHEGLYVARRSVTRRRLLVFFALQVVWSNSHAISLFGPLFYVVSFVTERCANRVRQRCGAPSKPLCLPGYGIPLLFAATLITPNHFWVYWFSFGQRAHMLVVDEWWSLWSIYAASNPIGLPPIAFALAGVAVLAPLVALARLARQGGRAAVLGMPSRGFVLAAIGAVAGLYAVRFTWLWFIPLGFLLAPRGPRAPAAELQGTAPEAARFPGSKSLLLGVASFAVACVFWTQLPRPFELSRFSESTYSRGGLPTKLCDFFLEAGLEGKLYNAYTHGGYLLYRLYPHGRVFVDGRTVLYGADLLGEFSRSVASKKARAQTLDDHRVDVVVGTLDVYGCMDGESDWVSVYRTTLGSVYVRSSSEGEALLARVSDYYRRHKIPFAPGRGFDPLAAVRANPTWSHEHGLLTPALQRAEEAVERAGLTTASDELLNGLLTRGKHLEKFGQWEGALADYRRTRSLLPPNAPTTIVAITYLRASEVLIRLGRLEEAERELEEGSRATPNASEIWRQLARMALLRGDAPLAEQHLKRALGQR